MGRRLALTAVALIAVGGSCTAWAAHRSRPAAPRTAVTLDWVGDIALSTQRGLPPGGLVGALSPVRSELRSADLTAGNLEGTLSVGGVSKCDGTGGGNCFAFQAPIATAGQLQRLGFDWVNQANNHSLDYGVSGRNQTVAALNGAGVAHAGFPGEITVLKARGRRIAFVGFAPYSSTANLLDIPAGQALVRQARQRASLVVVIIHAGAEGAGALHVPSGSESFLGENRGNPRAFAHAVINAGASIVAGSGPHVVRGIEYYHRRLIAYSLGNFVGYHTLAGGGVLAESGILRVTLGPGGRLLAGRWFSVHLSNGLPSPERSNASAHLVGRLSGQDFPTDHLTIRANGFFRLPGEG